MKKQTKLTLLSLALALAGSSSYAISFDLEADRLDNSAGVAMPTSGLVVLVASTLDSSFGTVFPNASLAVGSALDGADDIILWKGNLAASATPGVLADSPSGLNLGTSGGSVANWTGGDALALYWFPNLTLGSSNASLGQQYGRYTSATGLDGSSPWLTPSNNAANGYKLYFFTSDMTNILGNPTASNSAASGDASFTVVPEPGTFALLGLGLSALALRRRSRR